jgi:hypothetical protein
MSAPAIISSGTAAGGPPVGGSGTPGTIPVWSGSGTTLTNSIVTQSGTLLGVNKAVPTSTFDVDGLQANTGVTSASAPTGTIRLNFAGSPSAGQYGASVVFSQQWFAGNPTQYIAVGQITGVKTAASGFYGGGLSFWYNNGGNALVEGMRMTDTGNVGIGTASPVARLTVLGTSTWNSDTVKAFRVGSSATATKAVDIGFDTVLDAGFIQAANFGVDYRPLLINPNAGTGVVAINTTTPVAGRSLTTGADIDVYGVRVGRGAGAVATNTAVGSGALSANTTGALNTAVGSSALRDVSTGNNNTAVGTSAMIQKTGSSNVAVGMESLWGTGAGNNNVAIGYQAQRATTTGSSNTVVGYQGGITLTTGASNVIIGAGADVAAVGDSNKLVLGSAGNYVATNGGATTYYATAGASLGYIQVRLNGADVKIQVFAP